jgi:hypothetical protein
MACVDTETGEIVDPEALDALLMQRDEKLEAVALWIKNLQSDALAYKAEKEAFAARQKAAEDKVESLKRYLADALQGQKFSTAKCAVSFRKSEKVDILDASLVPQDFMKEKVTYEPDKTAIKAAIKAGQEISGCKLIESNNPTIK